MTRIGRMNADSFLIRENPPIRVIRGLSEFTTMNLLRSICVYCGSSMGTKDVYRQAAEQLGRELVSRGIRLVYGAGSVGLMGVLARTVYDRGGDVLGVIPTLLSPREVAGDAIGETIVVEIDARAQGADDRRGRRLHRHARRLWHHGRTVRGHHLGPTRHPSQADWPVQRQRLLRPAACSGSTRRSRKVLCARNTASCSSSATIHRC